LVSELFAPADDERLTSRVRSVFPGEGDSPAEVNITLFHVAEGDETDEDVEMLLDGIANRLTEEGLSPDQVDTGVARGEDPQDAIVDASDNYDVIVMGESDPSVTTFLFGKTADQVAKQYLGPVFVLQHEQVDGDEEEEAA
jgi:nucleotide-binding universal stress UspA family protein